MRRRRLGGYGVGGAVFFYLEDALVEFRDKRVLITGGSKGIGKAIAGELVGRGAAVFLVARGKQALEAAREELIARVPGALVGIGVCDVSSYSDAQTAVGAMLHEFGGIDGVLNNAGYAVPGYFEKIAAEEFERHMRVNYLGGVYVTRAAIPHLREGSFIGFTSSVAGLIGVFGYTAYCPAKFAQVGFAEALQQELAPRGIRVAVLCPPDTETPGLEAENATKPYETRELSRASKLMSAEEVARRFIDKLAKGAFIITVNRESARLYWLHRIAPSKTRRMLNRMIAKAQAKKISL